MKDKDPLTNRIIGFVGEYRLDLLVEDAVVVEVLIDFNFRLRKDGIKRFVP